MFLILKTTDWKEENYIEGNIIPFGWCEDNNRAIPKNEKEKLNNEYVKHLRVNYV